MELHEIKAYLDQNSGKADVQAFVKGLNPITLDAVKDFASKDETAKTWLQSQKDSHFDKSIETWKKNNLDELVMAKVDAMYPKETEEQKRIKLLEEKLAAAENKEKREALKNKAISLATEKELPTGLVDYFLGEDEETTVANLAKLEETFNPFIDAKVDARFKETGRKFPKGSGGSELSEVASIAAAKNGESKPVEGPNPWATN